MNHRIVITYIVLLAFSGLIAFTYITRSSNNAYAGLNDTEFDERVKQVISNNPELIVQSVNNWQRQEAEAEQSNMQRNAQTIYQQILADDSLARIGSGSVKVVEFYDYMCGYCKKMAPIKSKYITKGIEFITIANPVLGEQSMYLAQATEAMRMLAPQSYESIHLEILSSNRSANLKKLVNDLLVKYNINQDEFSQAMNSTKVTEQLNKGVGYANKIGIRGTPAYIIDGKLYMGALPESKFKELVTD